MNALFIVLAVAVLFILAVALYASFEITKVPYLALPYTPQDFGLAYEPVSFKSFDGLTLTGWFIPSKEASDTTLIVLHGLGSNTGDMLLNVLCLARAGSWNLFLFNFRGHSDSEGRLTSIGPLELRDFESALEYLKRAKPEAARRLGLYGHSLGASVAIVGAARHPEIAAVVAESPFTRARKTVTYFAKLFYGIPEFPFMHLAFLITRWRLGVSSWNFAPVDEVGKIAPRPFLLIHAERDLRMPASDTQAMMDAAGDPKELWVVPGADHGEPWMIAKEDYDNRIVQFFRRVFP